MHVITTWYLFSLKAQMATSSKFQRVFMKLPFKLCGKGN